MQVINKTQAPAPVIEIIKNFLLSVLLKRIPQILSGIITIIIDKDNNCELLDVQVAMWKKEGKSESEIKTLLSEMTHVGCKYSSTNACIITGVTGYESKNAEASRRQYGRANPRVKMQQNEQAREERLQAIKNTSVKSDAKDSGLSITDNAKVSQKILNSLLDFVINVLRVRVPVITGGTITIAYNPKDNSCELLKFRVAKKEDVSGMQVLEAKYSLSDSQVILHPVSKPEKKKESKKSKPKARKKK